MKHINITVCEPSTRDTKGIFDQPNRFNGSNKRTVEQGLAIFKTLHVLTAQAKNAEINKLRSALLFDLKTVSSSARLKHPDPEELAFAHQVIEHKVRKANPSQFIVTHEQLEFMEMVKHYSKRRFAESVQFGTFTLDAFTPIFSGKLKSGHITSLFKNSHAKSVLSYRQNFLGAPNGFVFEVNGKCHDANQGRINKDAVKANAIHGCNLFLLDISNQDVRKNSTATFLRNLEQLELNCSRTREKIWSRIHLFTIACLAEDQMIQDLFGLKLSQLKHLAVKLHKVSRDLLIDRAG